MTRPAQSSPSSGTPGEGWGGGELRRADRVNPLPSPPPEYREREQSAVRPKYQRGIVQWALVLLFLLLSTSVGHAAPTQNDVFKSIQDSLGHEEQQDYRPYLLFAAGAAILLLIVVVSNRRQQAARAPGPLNSPGKLMKEVLRDVPLKSGEVKQLKVLAESIESTNGDEVNPLTLLLCPSLMAKGLQASGDKVDKKTVAQVVRKLRSKS
jgi:hypothetical protein